MSPPLTRIQISKLAVESFCYLYVCNILKFQINFYCGWRLGTQQCSGRHQLLFYIQFLVDSQTGIMKKFVKVCLISVGFAAAYALLVGRNSRQFHNIPMFYLLVAGIHILQILAFIPAAIFHTEKFFDLCGSLTFILATLLCLTTSTTVSLKQKTTAAMLLIWSVRLGCFLYYRILKVGEDSRFQTIKKQTSRFLMSWILQALWVTLTAGPVFSLLTSARNENGNYSDIGGIQLIGFLLWLVGFAVQSIADLQKIQFKFDETNRGRFIQSGLWKFSRHPNYFGEVIVWLGISIFTFRSLQGLENLSMISPFFVYLLLTKVSGIPLLEAKAEEKWGGKVQYEEYKKITPILFPTLKSVAKVLKQKKRQ